MLGLSQDYQSLARWYSLSGGSDFRAYLSAFYPHLSADASRDFSSGSSVFFSALRAVASAIPLPPVSPAPPPLPSVAPASFSQAAALPPLPAPVSAPSGGPVSPFSLPPVSRSGVGVSAVSTSLVSYPAPQPAHSSSTSSAVSPVLSVLPGVRPQAPLPPSQPLGASPFQPPASSFPAVSLAWSVSAAPGMGSAPGVPLASGVSAGSPVSRPAFPAASTLPQYVLLLSAPLQAPLGFPRLLLAPPLVLLVLLLLLALLQLFLRCLAVLCLLLLLLSRILLLVLTMLSLLVLVVPIPRVLCLQILELRLPPLCLTLRVLRFGVCISI